jgi:hypothetical protein
VDPNKGPLKCWGCGEPHLLRDCPHRQHENQTVYNVQEVATINDIAKSVSRIYTTVENQQANHQASMVELEGVINE